MLNNCTEQENIHSVLSPRCILFETDGDIHIDTFKKNTVNDVRRPCIKTENSAVADVGAAIYEALDYGVGKIIQKS